MNCVTVLWNLELEMQFFFFNNGNQTTGFPLHVTFKGIKIWSRLELGCKVKPWKYVHIFNKVQIFSDISHHS